MSLNNPKGTHAWIGSKYYEAEKDFRKTIAGKAGLGHNCRQARHVGLCPTMLISAWWRRRNLRLQPARPLWHRVARVSVFCAEDLSLQAVLVAGAIACIPPPYKQLSATPSSGVGQCAVGLG